MHNVFELEGYSFILFGQRDKSQEIVSSKSRTVSSYGLKHGDMIYLFLSPEQKAGNLSRAQPVSASGENGVTVTATPPSDRISGSKIPKRCDIAEDQVDRILQKTAGTIKRSRDPKK